MIYRWVNTEKGPRLALLLDDGRWKLGHEILEKPDFVTPYWERDKETR